MADTSSRRRPTSRHAQADFTLEAEVLPAVGVQPYTLRDALHLVATWAARAARARPLEADPDRSPQPGGAGQQHEATQEADQ